ncbi:DUF6350 family protein [Nocardioides sp.]|uniref:cell division protein PerM n=1 Tax=Nocardioides sp. TaxID=35761 RepID=UPI0039E35FCF
MTSLLQPPTRSSVEVSADLRHRRPLVLVATLGGVLAAVLPLLVCLAAGVVGWFLTEDGAFGAPRDALRVGATGWLMAHGSGVTVRGTAVTVVPLGLTLVCLWALWRIGNRVGDSISGHGPDADRISDGERDWTVPAAAGLFTVGYAVAVAVTGSLAATPGTGLGVSRATTWGFLMALVVGGTGIAVGSGRAAIWVAWLPPTLRAALRTTRAVLVGWLLVGAIALVAAFVVDATTAANVLSQLHTDAGESTLYAGVTAGVLPNATAFAGSYLLGPGFTVGIDTLVSPGAVVLGPLPMFPLLAALPDAGNGPAWAPWLLLLAPLTAFLAVARVQRRHPALRWEEGVVRGLTGGVGAGILFGIVAGISGGAAGPGRMADVHAHALDVTLHAVVSFGLGGLLAGLAMTWWQRRRYLPAP